MNLAREKEGLSLDTRALATAWGRGETVLLVDDGPELRAILSRLLRRLGYQVVAASGVDEALELIWKAPTRFDLVITDLLLGNSSGVELWRAVRRGGLRTPFIFATGHDRQAELLRDVTDGHILGNPVSIAQLSYTVRDVLDGLAPLQLPLSA